MHICRTLNGVSPSIKFAASFMVRTRFLSIITSTPLLRLFKNLLTQRNVKYRIQKSKGDTYSTLNTLLCKQIIHQKQVGHYGFRTRRRTVRPIVKLYIIKANREYSRRLTVRLFARTQDFHLCPFLWDSRYDWLRLNGSIIILQAANTLVPLLLGGCVTAFRLTARKSSVIVILAQNMCGHG